MKHQVSFHALASLSIPPRIVRFRWRVGWRVEGGGRREEGGGRREEERRKRKKEVWGVKKRKREGRRKISWCQSRDPSNQPGKAYYTWHAFISTTFKSLRWSMKVCWQIYYKQKQKPVSPWAKYVDVFFFPVEFHQWGLTGSVCHNKN